MFTINYKNLLNLKILFFSDYYIKKNYIFEISKF